MCVCMVGFRSGLGTASASPHIAYRNTRVRTMLAALQSPTCHVSLSLSLSPSLPLCSDLSLLSLVLLLVAAALAIFPVGLIRSLSILYAKRTGPSRASPMRDNARHRARRPRPRALRLLTPSPCPAASSGTRASGGARWRTASPPAAPRATCPAPRRPAPRPPPPAGRWT